MNSILFVLVFIISYLIGSIPTAYILMKKIKNIDITKVGSGNPGATNVFRTGSRVLGIITFLIDFTKGVIPTMITKIYLSSFNSYLLPIVMLSVVVGHATSIFLRFRGGKGVATGSGALLVVSPESFLICFIVFVVFLLISRFVSLSSILSSLTLVILIIFSHLFSNYNLEERIIFCIVPILIILKHKSNITRLLTGKENKIF